MKLNSSIRILFPVLTFALLIGGCCTFCDNAQEKGAEESIQDISTNIWWPPILSTTSPVSQNEVDAGKECFRDYVRSATDDVLPIERFIFTRNSLVEIIEGFNNPNCTGKIPLIGLYHGMTAEVNGRLTYAIGCGCYELSSQKTVVHPETLYVVNGSNNLVLGPSLTEWQAVQQAYYFNGQVNFKRNNNLVLANPAFDAKMYWNEASKIHTFLYDNEEREYVEIFPVQDKISDEETTQNQTDLRTAHGNVWIPTSKQGNNFSNHYDGTWNTSTQSFKDVAMNLGSPCPKNCDYFRPYYKGNELRCP